MTNAAGHRPAAPQPLHPTLEPKEMIMSDHPNDAVTVLVTLDLPALCRAARLGGGEP